jgi:oxygen-independent coproporphyrinogen-3 oxidase
MMLCHNTSLLENTTDWTLPKSAYIHIPFCVRKCLYCDFAVVAGTTNLNLYDTYIEHLLKEIEITLGYFKRKYQKLPALETLYIGGGTPSVLSYIHLQRIVDKLQQYVDFAPTSEFTVEMDPATFDLSKARQFRNLGVNRVSIGVQSFDDNLLKLCGRSHNSKQAYMAWDILRTAGFTNLSLDLMSGLPYQSEEIFRVCLRYVYLLN